MLRKKSNSDQLADLITPIDSWWLPTMSRLPKRGAWFSGGLSGGEATAGGAHSNLLERMPHITCFHSNPEGFLTLLLTLEVLTPKVFLEKYSTWNTSSTDR
jgi:hypothetical protein